MRIYKKVNYNIIAYCQYLSVSIHNYSGVSWPSGLAYRTQVLVLATECGFESRPWHLCPWARHLIIIASLLATQGLNGYLWGQSWLTSTSPICAVMAAIELYTPQELRWFQEWCMSRGNNAPWAPLSWWIRALYKSTYYYYYYRRQLVVC